MRKSYIINDELNHKIMKLVSKLINNTGQTWSASVVVNSLILFALQKDITPEKIIHLQDELDKLEEKVEARQ